MTHEELEKLSENMPNDVIMVMARDETGPKDKGTFIGWSKDWVARCVAEPAMVDKTIDNLATAAAVLTYQVELMNKKMPKDIQ